MLLTRKTDSAAKASGSSAFVGRLQRGLSQALPTLDRRGFMRTLQGLAGSAAAAAAIAPLLAANSAWLRWRMNNVSAWRQ